MNENNNMMAQDWSIRKQVVYDTYIPFDNRTRSQVIILLYTSLLSVSFLRETMNMFLTYIFTYMNEIAVVDKSHITFFEHLTNCH